MPDGLLGVAWPSMRASFELPLDALGSLLILFTTGYLLSSAFSGWILKHVNVGALLALSCLATSISLCGYALAPRWWILVAFGFLSGLGAGAIDAGLNTYVATYHSARTVNWLHACYGMATTAGPAMMTFLLVSGRTWRFGYGVIAAGQFALAIAFALSYRLWPATVTPAIAESSAHSPGTPSAGWRSPALWLSVAVFFAYTGIEAAAGAWPYSLFTEARGIPAVTAGSWASVYWACFTVGRIASGLAAHHITVHHLMRLCIGGMIVGAALLWINLTSLLSFAGVSLIGLACAPIFPMMIATTPGRVSEKLVAHTVGLQISAAVLGQSFLPAVVGLLADWQGLEVLAPTLLAASLTLLVVTETLFTRFQPEQSAR